MIVNKYARKPFYVDAVQVTAENMAEVAQWCGGRVETTVEINSHSFIKVKVKRPISARQTKAFIGDWVLKAGAGYKVYTAEAFDKSFDALTIREQKAPVFLNAVESAVDAITAEV
jgi:hypothetical protein